MINNQYFNLKKREQDYYNNICKKENENTTKEDENKGKQQEQQEIENGSENEKDEDTNTIYEYNKTTNDYIEYQKKKGVAINMLNIGKNIEDGIFELADNFDSNKTKIIDIFNGNFKSDNNIEGFVNKSKIS